MKTIVLEKPGSFQLTERPSPGDPAPGQALVRIHRVGVCGSDIHAFKGNQPFFTYPRVVGHELGVEIVAVGPNEKGLAVGDRCAVEPYLHCGRCIACRRGKTNCCVALQVLGVHTDGGMCEFIAVPVGKLHRSRTLSPDQLALVEMLTIGAHAVRRAQLEPGENVLGHRRRPHRARHDDVSRSWSGRGSASWRSATGGATSAERTSTWSAASTDAGTPESNWKRCLAATCRRPSSTPPAAPSP